MMTLALLLALQDRPNVVVFLVDDLGARDLRVTGSSFYDTPHLDALARDGMTFTRAYAACPVCSPTRASLLTGRWPQRTGITDWIGAAQPWTRPTKMLPPPYAESAPALPTPTPRPTGSERGLALTGNLPAAAAPVRISFEVCADTGLLPLPDVCRRTSRRSVPQPVPNLVRQLFDVLDLLAHLLDQHLNIDSRPRRLRVLRLR